MPSLFDRYLAPGAQPHLDGTETARQPVGLRPEQAVAFYSAATSAFWRATGAGSLGNVATFGNASALMRRRTG